MEYLQKISAKRSQKIVAVNSLNEKLTNSNSVIVIRPEGLTVEEVTKFRKILTQANVNLFVTKNTLARKAIKDTIYQDLDSLFAGGPTAIAYSSDNVAVAKNIVNYAKENEKIKILGGVIDKKLVDVESVKAIATLPSLDELRAKLIGLINAPATAIAGVIKAPSEKLVRVFGAYSTKE